MAARTYFRNNGDKTFSNVPDMFPYGDTMHSFATGDVNRDGQVDVYASYGNSYVSPDNGNDDVLWINNGNPDQHWITFELEGFQSNRDAVGATVEITGAFGTQVRSVRAGELRHDVDVLLPLWAGCQRRGGNGDGVWPSGLTTELTTRRLTSTTPCSKCLARCRWKSPLRPRNSVPENRPC